MFAEQIGIKHGSEAQSKVHGSLSFYAWVFETLSDMTWAQALETVSKFMGPISRDYPRYMDEMKGIADGAKVSIEDIVALNVRSEIAFAMYAESKAKQQPMESDGCTSLAWRVANGKSFLAQNWDWMQAQQENLIILHVEQDCEDLVPFEMITEAGIIGKIGLNKQGIGCCLNAIRARGVDPSKMPVHFALRTVLESATKALAIEKIKAAGVAASAHILIGDADGAVGLECTSQTFAELSPDSSGRICHANNLLGDHPGVEEPEWPDSPKRTARMQQLTSQDFGENAGFESILEVFKDEENFPTSINRCQEGTSRSGTLFNIVLELNEKRGVVSLGRPTQVLEQVTLAF